MKKLLFAMMVLLACSACHRPRVRHDSKAKMQQVRLPVDSAQKNDIDKADESWSDENLIVVPEEAPNPHKAIRNVDQKIERMMSGEEVDMDE